MATAVPDRDGDIQTTDRVADGRPEGAGHGTFGAACERLTDPGHEPLPPKPGRNIPDGSRWSGALMTLSTIDGWRRTFARRSVGLRTGRLPIRWMGKLGFSASQIAKLIDMRLSQGRLPLRRISFIQIGEILTTD
ncbi:hypothetical protein [Tropicibacter sp. S64]|uniref:hypothetical protein n=1 Tax=Tropicibacter sp. S64 TaxID=3415122 RepID=UPI003C7E7193